MVRISGLEQAELGRALLATVTSLAALDGLHYLIPSSRLIADVIVLAPGNCGVTIRRRRVTIPHWLRYPSSVISSTYTLATRDKTSTKEGDRAIFILSIPTFIESGSVQKRTCEWRKCHEHPLVLLQGMHRWQEPLRVMTALQAAAGEPPSRRWILGRWRHDGRYRDLREGKRGKKQLKNGPDR